MSKLRHYVGTFKTNSLCWCWQHWPWTGQFQEYLESSGSSSYHFPRLQCTVAMLNKDTPNINIRWRTVEFTLYCSSHTFCYMFEYWTDLVIYGSICFGQDQRHRFHVLGKLELVWLLAIQAVTKNLCSFLGLKDVQWPNGHPSSSLDKFHVSLVYSLQIDFTENMLITEGKLKNSLTRMG